MARLRTMIFLFKTLRESASPELLKKIYVSLCQSVINYCIPVWGGASKIRFLELERAQRAVLKVMTRKPFKYPTTHLYADCQLLSIRQLYVLASIQRRHRTVSPLQCNNNRRRNPPPCPRVSHTTFFAERHYYVMSSKLYNRINKNCNIQNLTTHEAKNLVKKYLLQLNYQETENLLTFTI